jgi:hypothetical protein
MLGRMPYIKSCYYLDLNSILYYNYTYKTVQSAYKIHIKY